MLDQHRRAPELAGIAGSDEFLVDQSGQRPNFVPVKRARGGLHGKRRDPVAGQTFRCGPWAQAKSRSRKLPHRSSVSSMGQLPGDDIWAPGAVMLGGFETSQIGAFSTPKSLFRDYIR